MKITSKLAVALGLCVVTSTACADKVLKGPAVSSAQGLGVATTVLTNRTDFTIEAWVKPLRAYTSNINPIFSVYSGGNQAADFVFGLLLNKPTAFHRSGTEGTSIRFQSSATVLADDVWRHVALVHTASNVTFYVDGERLETIAAKAGSDEKYKPLGKSVCAIGGQFADTETTSTASGWGGSLSDVRVWTTLRTDAEIAANYQKRLTGGEEGLAIYVPFHDANGQVCPDRASGETVLVNNLATSNKWTLEEDAGLNLEDAFPAPVPGFPLHHASATPAQKVGTDVQLTGDKCTVEVWMNTEKLNRDNAIFAQRNGTTKGCFCVGILANKLNPFIYLHNGSKWGIYSATNEVVAKAWNHLAFVRDGKSYRIYVNGVLGLEEDNGYDTSFITGTNAVLFNAMNNATGTSGCGSLRELRVWNTARTESEILASMRQKATGREEGLVGYWPLTEGYGRFIRNVVTGYDSPLTSIFTWPAETVPVLDFAEDVETESSPSFGGGWCAKGATGVKAQLNDFTIEAWVRPRPSTHKTYNDSADHLESIISQENNADNLPGRWFFGLNNHNNPTFFMRDADKQGGWYQSGAIVPQGRWSHVAVTRAGTELSFFVDGKLVATKTCVDCATANLDFTIGKAFADRGFYGSGWAHAFDGLIREVRVWNYARSEGNIAKYRTKKLSQKDSGLVGYWPLDDANDGATLRNVAGADGTLYAGWTNDEKVPLTGTVDSVSNGLTILIK